MYFLKATLITFTALIFLPSTVHAADCTTYDANMQWFLSYAESQIWGLRQSACGDNACGSNQVCTLTAYNRYGGIKLYRKDVQYEFPNCWVSYVASHSLSPLFQDLGHMRIRI